MDIELNAQRQQPKTTNPKKLQAKGTRRANDPTYHSDR